MFKPRFIKTESGDELVVLSRQHYDDLLDREAHEDIEESIYKRINGGDGWLVAARKAREWSQPRLAKESGVSQSYISRLEKDFCRHRPTHEVVVKLS